MTTETAMQNLFDIAWTQKDRDKLYTPVLTPNTQQETQTIKLKCMFTFTPGQPNHIIIRREYYQALQDAISFFHGVGQFYTRYTEEDKESEWGMLIDADAETKMGEEEEEEEEDKIPIIDWELGKEIKNRHQVFFVTGSSGIGKTLWLYFVLVERLLRNLPTYFQTKPNVVSFWSQNGVSHLPTTSLSTEIPEDIWYLFDSNSDVINPPRDVQESSCRIVVTASYREPRFKWADKLVNTDYKWNMKPTSVREVVTMNPYQEEAIPISQLYEFTELFGTCARHVFKYAQKINTYRQELQMTLRAMTLDGFRNLVQLPDPNNRIVGVYPGPTRDDPYVFIHTSEILRMVKQRFGPGAEWDRGVWELFDTFRRDDDTRAVARRILEDRIHEVLAAGGKWRGVELLGGENTHVWLSLGPGAEISTSEPRAPEAALDVRRFRSGEEEDLTTTGYYRGTQTQDSFVLDVERKTMVVIQSTRQDVKKTDLEFEERWQQLRIQAGYRVYYVLITDNPKNVDIPISKSYEHIFDQRIHICMSKKDLFPNAPAGGSSSLRVWGYKPGKQ